MSKTKQCNCHSYNWQTGQEENVILRAPKHFGFTKDVCIDACIAPAVKALWDADIVTVNSCCGHGKMNPSIILQESATSELVERAKIVVSEVDDRRFDFLSWKLVNCDSDVQNNTEFKLTTIAKQRDELAESLSNMVRLVENRPDGYYLEVFEREEFNDAVSILSAIKGRKYANSDISKDRLETVILSTPNSRGSWVEDSLNNIDRAQLQALGESISDRYYCQCDNDQCGSWFQLGKEGETCKECESGKLHPQDVG